eukprot:SAG31_NODE_17715_length_660_cov_1.012478_2_plen_166_part_01
MNERVCTVFVLSDPHPAPVVYDGQVLRITGEQAPLGQLPLLDADMTVLDGGAVVLVSVQLSRPVLVEPHGDLQLTAGSRAAQAMDVLADAPQPAGSSPNFCFGVNSAETIVESFSDLYSHGCEFALMPRRCAPAPAPPPDLPDLPPPPARGLSSGDEPCLSVVGAA